MSEPRSVGDAISRIVGSMTSSRGPMLDVLEWWETAVGEHIAAHARPRRLTDGVLLVEVDDPAWATQLTYVRRTLLEQLNASLGAGTIERIDLVVAGRRGR